MDDLICVSYRLVQLEADSRIISIYKPINYSFILKKTQQRCTIAAKEVQTKLNYEKYSTSSAQPVLLDPGKARATQFTGKSHPPKSLFPKIRLKDVRLAESAAAL